MQITSILDIIDGRLLNHPSISFIYSIKTNPKKVKEGDLFIVKNSQDIDLAIENGAFALIVDDIVEIKDNEIAWIYVKSLDETIVKLARYLLSNRRLNAFYCNSVSYELFQILKKTTNHSNIKLIPNDLSKIFKTIDELEENDTLICDNKEILNNIYPVNFNFNTKKYEIKNLIEHSIFETSFSFQDRYFSKIKISSLYISEFLDVYSYLGFNSDLNKLKKFNNLKPIFVDKMINHTDFGKSDKFLIAQKDASLVPKEIEYLENKYSYAKILYLGIDNNSIQNYENKLNIDLISIESMNDLKKFLKRINFNAIYFIGISHDTLFDQISKQNNEPSLLNS